MSSPDPPRNLAERIVVGFGEHMPPGIAVEAGGGRVVMRRGSSFAAFEVDLGNGPEDLHTLLDNMQDFVCEHTGDQWPAPKAVAAVERQPGGALVVGYRTLDGWVIRLDLGQP